MSLASRPMESVSSAEDDGEFGLEIGLGMAGSYADVAEQSAPEPVVAPEPVADPQPEPEPEPEPEPKPKPNGVWVSFGPSKNALGLVWAG